VQWNYLAFEATDEDLPRLPECDACGAAITRSRRSTRRYCRDGCRQKTYRDRERGVTVDARREKVDRIVAEALHQIEIRSGGAEFVKTLKETDRLR
jgi:hypothetical protein